MNTTLRNTLIVLAVLVLAGALFFAGSVYARTSVFRPFNMMGYFDKDVNAYGPSMMRGNGNMMSGSGYGPGMMTNGRGSMMGGSGYGPGMMTNGSGPMMYGYGFNTADLTPLTIEQAQTAAENYLATFDNADLKIAEIMIFDNNAYIVVKEISTGNGAFELLADSASRTAYPEHGPNMMWNLKYSGLNHQNMMMGGYGNMMGFNFWNNAVPTDLSAEMNVTPEQAIEYAQAYLDANISNATVAMDPIRFYGYYTLDYEVNGKVAGMLSVNGYSGQVFPHTWHGTFIEESEIQ